MNLELELALRFLKRRTSILLRGTALAAWGSVALATAALVITLALMAGYQRAIAGALQQGNAHMVGFAAKHLDLAGAQRLAEAARQVSGVRRASPVTYLMGLIEDPREPANPLPVVLKAVAEPPEFTALERWPGDGILPAAIGGQLASQLGIEIGDTATVLLPPKPGRLALPSLRIRAISTFHLAFSEFDHRWLVVPLERVLEAAPGTEVAGVELLLDDPLAVAEMRPLVEEAVPQLIFSDWREMNRQLFAALEWQTLSLFVVLTLVVAVASFQVSSSLVVLAINKKRATGMLQALGATPARVRRVLVLAGSLLGGLGIATGTVFGWLACLVMTRMEAISFPEGLAQVYMVDSIPLVVLPSHMLAVLAVCGLLVFFASYWPAWKASRLDPVAALKAV